MRKRDNYQRWSAQATLGTGDATKTVKAAPGALKRLVVTNYVLTVVTAAAQAVDLEDTSGTVEVCKLGASASVHAQFRSPNMEEGLTLTVNEALILKPASAGPAMHVWAEGYIESAA